MRIRLVKNKKDLVGIRLPKWYGRAYDDFVTQKVILYIIPLNLIVRYSVGIYWFFLRWIQHGSWEKKLEDIYWCGFNDGNIEREHHMDRLAKIILDGLKK